jgi:hypothetical protein
MCGRPPTPLGILPPNANDQALGLAVVERTLPLPLAPDQSRGKRSITSQVCSVTRFRSLGKGPRLSSRVQL